MGIEKPDRWCADHIDHGTPYSGFAVESSVLAFTSFINTTAPIHSVQKRLKEIAWYSKIESPFLSGTLDPATIEARMGLMSDEEKADYEYLYTGGLPFPFTVKGCCLTIRMIYRILPHCKFNFGRGG